ncbi:jg26692 [Pararge aegeria aegeria]|uniref:Jg26692 protein n=1 Tax=Pararge aegeria aegeria TaxID=348720 RepID=A0A8S4RKY3_9NEOP|nr:jg26692 [Pararge aegeria aegeria]
MSSRRSMLGSALDSLPAPSDPLRDLFEACKIGDVARAKKLITPQTVNARDTAGRKSTPLHFAAVRAAWWGLCSITLSPMRDALKPSLLIPISSGEP